MQPYVKLTATKETTFDAAHHLPFYNGVCARTHGHTYKLQATVSRLVAYDKKFGNIDKEHITEDARGITPERYMVMDFTVLKDILKRVCDRLDHTDLNNLFAFPTAEFISAYLFDYIREELKNSGVTLESIKLWETPTSFVECRGEFIELNE